MSEPKEATHDDKPKILVTNTLTGECREYETDNEVDLEQSMECINNHFDWISRAKRNVAKARHKEHIRMMQEKALDYVDTEGFQTSYSAVLMIMLGCAKYGGRVPMTNAQLGEKLKCSRQTISRAIAHLIQNDMIRKGYHEGREYYFLQPEAASKGTLEMSGTEDIAAKHQQRAQLKLLKGGKS